jgi:hypothetical protein
MLSTFFIGRMGVSNIELVSTDDLYEVAHAAQLAARNREATPVDTFLMTPSTTIPSPDQPTSALPFTSSLEGAVVDLLGARSGRRSGEGFSEGIIRRVLGSQRCDCATAFEVSRREAARIATGEIMDPSHLTFSSSALLPGGAPLVDHLRVRLNATPDWQVLRDQVDALTVRRLPDTRHEPQVMEITIGETSAPEVSTLLASTRELIARVKGEWGWCLLAADAEMVMACPDFSIPTPGKDVNSPFRLRLTKTGEKGGKPFPVRFMLGHVGWALHLRLHATGLHEGGRRILVIQPGVLQPELLAFLREVPYFCGVGVSQDLLSFSNLLSGMYGKSASFYDHRRVLELSLIAGIAGYEMPRKSVGSMCWFAFGTVLPKGICSTGDGRWHEPYHRLPTPLQLYLEGDITQVAAIAWLLVTARLIVTFPDLHLVSQISAFTPAELAACHGEFLMTCLQGVIKNQETPLEWGRWEALRRYCPGTRPHVILTPKWPNVTAGGPRYLHSARAWVLEAIRMTGQEMDERWMLPSPNQRQAAMFGRFEVSVGQVTEDLIPTAPVQTMGWAPNPGLEVLTGPPDAITREAVLARVGGGVSHRALFMEYARLNPLLGQDLLGIMERSFRAPARFFRCVKKGPSVVRGIRQVLVPLGLMPERPDGWIDKFVPSRRQEQVDRQIGDAEQLVERLRERGEQMLARANLGAQRLAVVKRRREELVSGSWVPEFTSAASDLRPIVPEVARMVGEAVPMAKRPRVDLLAPPSPGPLPSAEDITSSSSSPSSSSSSSSPSDSESSPGSASLSSSEPELIIEADRWSEVEDLSPNEVGSRAEGRGHLSRSRAARLAVERPREERLVRLVGTPDRRSKAQLLWGGRRGGELSSLDQRLLQLAHEAEN